ncbi:hypothetical protein NMG60_11036736 [Bertholletia excelsa]
MAGEKKNERSQSAAKVLKPDSYTNLTEQEAAPAKDGKPSVLNSSVLSEDASSIKGEISQEPAAEQDVYCPPTSCYDYYYPGYNGTFTQPDNNNYNNTGFQSDNGSLLYYMPGYNPYATGSFMGADGQQPYYATSGYLQHPVSYGSETMTCYSWDSTYAGDVANGTTGFSGRSKSSPGATVSTKSNYCDSMKSSSTLPGKFSMSPTDSGTRKSGPVNQPTKTMGKLGPGYQSATPVKGIHSARKLPSPINQSPGLFMHNTPIRPYGRVWYGNNRDKLRDRKADTDASAELTRGPRTQNVNNLLNRSSEEKYMESTVERDKYNRAEFQTQYDNAKFFVIKSYSEDDIHKCVKYDVWSSTPNGNRKLDVAFQEAEEQSSDTGTRCPVFLLFSVNASGQFVGVAEMIGPVDFNKNMDFWQIDKWTGFFPVQWHVIKDIPNAQLRHIILENNDNRPVTYSRDTQEIGLKQGIEMLNIFKSYSGKTSILDDFNFYETREKQLKARRDNETPKHSKRGENTSEEAVATDGLLNPTPSLIKLTRNLSINCHSSENSYATKTRE